MRVLPALLASALSASLAAAQGTAPRAQAPDLRPLIDARVPSDGPTSKRPIPPLTPDQLGHLRDARNLKTSGLLEQAVQLLNGLNREVPHHPLVVTELAQIRLERGELAAAEKLARTERAAARDSVLLARELSFALERLGRPREAAEVVLGAWIASAPEEAWASSTVERLSLADPRGIRPAVRKAVERLPDRPDLQSGLARLEWQGGDLDATQRALAAADRAGRQPSSRWLFANQLLTSGTSRDTLGAIESLVALAGDTSRQQLERTQAARRVWMLIVQRSGDGSYALRLQQALKDVPVAQWDNDLLMGVARELRQSGRTNEARTLLSARGGDPVLGHTVTLERALADLRDGPPEKALPALEAASHGSLEALARFADALFFAGMADSALGRYKEIANQPQSPFAGAALERIYLIEDADPRDALPTFGRMAYEEWRGNDRVAATIAESLYRALPHGPMWAQAALTLSTRREQAGDAKAALDAALAVADSLPADRLAPVARQRAGDLYLTRFKDEAKALAQYEECLARYPRAWNSAEVRRRVEQLRRDRRF